MSSFHCRMVSPEAELFDGEVWQVSIPAVSGRFVIRSGHVPVVASIHEGVVEIARSENERVRFKVTSGIVEFSNAHCSIIGESGIPV